MMRQDILCGGIVRVSSVCMHSNEPFIMGCVVCVRCVPPVDTTAHRVDKAPHPARRRAAEVRSSVPRLAAYSAFRSWQWPGCGNARGPRAGPRRRPRDARDRPRRARSRAVRGSCIIEFSTARTRSRAWTARSGPDRQCGGPEALARSSAALSSALKRSVMSTPEKYQSVSNTHAETPTRYG